MFRRDGPAAGGAAGEADIGYADDRQSDTTLAQIRLAAFRRLRRARHIERIHAIGPSAIFELHDELDRHHGLGDDLDQRLARYARLDQVLLAAVGGDRFPNMPLRTVASSP